MVADTYILFSENEKCFRYGSGLALYTERLVDGRLICAGYQDNGTIVYKDHEFTDKPSFDLVMDGESMYYGWEFAGFEIREDPPGSTSGTLTLKHSFKPVQLEITTWCCGLGFFKRSIEITNLSDHAFLGLTHVVPLKGCIWNMNDNLPENLRDNTVIPYSAGHFKDIWWSNEGNFDWQDIPLNTGIFFGSTIGQSGHGSPFFILRNNLYGGYFVFHLGWTSNWKASLFTDYNNDRHSFETKVNLGFEIMPVSPSPARVIAPGETVQAPEVHFGLGHCDFDTVIQNLHAYLRKNVLKKVGDGLQPVIYNQAGYMHPSPGQPDMSEEGLKKEIDIAVEIGAELFMVDAG